MMTLIFLMINSSRGRELSGSPRGPASESAEFTRGCAPLGIPKISTCLKASRAAGAVCDARFGMEWPERVTLRLRAVIAAQHAGKHHVHGRAVASKGQEQRFEPPWHVVNDLVANLVKREGRIDDMGKAFVG